MRLLLGLLFFLTCVRYVSAQDALLYFNQIRHRVGLIPLERDERLEKAVLLHCKYMDQAGKLSHKEKPGKPFFTGKMPDQRAVQAGLHCRYVAENLSFNQENERDAINDLLATVYHRFSLLSPNLDIAGFAHYGRYYGLMLANSYLDSLCYAFHSNPDLISFIYVSVCDLYQKKIPLLDFLNALERVQQKNASIIVYPYPGQREVPVAFSEEEPNPVPKCFVVGYPITVEFNPYYYPLLPTNVVIKLRDSRGRVVPSRLLTASNDPHHKLNLYQYALLPKKVLQPSEKYWVELRYREGGVRHKKTWSFQTISFHSIVVLKGQKMIYVPSPAEFYVMVEPKNCRDTVFNNLHLKYSAEFFKVDYAGSLFLKIRIKGKKDQFAQIDMENGYSLRIIILGE